MVFGFVLIMIKKNTKKYSGITLLELIIVMAIISIFAAMSWRSFVNARTNAEVEGACSTIAGLINETRNMALTGEKVDGNVPGCFMIFFNRDGDYSVYGKGTCFGSMPPAPFLRGNVSTKTILTNYISNDSKYYLYEVPNGDVATDASGPSYGNIVVTAKSNNFIYKTVEVSPYRAVCR